jgi:hypothetical protein
MEVTSVGDALSAYVRAKALTTAGVVRCCMKK